MSQLKDLSTAEKNLIMANFAKLDSSVQNVEELTNSALPQHERFDLENSNSSELVNQDSLQSPQHRKGPSQVLNADGRMTSAAIGDGELGDE